MFEYRVTKYDPALRDARGEYMREEWTAFSDIGRSFGGVVLTREEYLRVECAYMASALAFFREAGVPTLTARDLQNPDGVPVAPTEGRVVSLEEVPDVIRGLLREEFWCRLAGPGAFAHVGWDYYMYIGVPRACPQAEQMARQRGLFAEPFDSPYRKRRDG